MPCLLGRSVCVPRSDGHSHQCLCKPPFFAPQSSNNGTSCVGYFKLTTLKRGGQSGDITPFKPSRSLKDRDQKECVRECAGTSCSVLITSSSRMCHLFEYPPPSLGMSNAASRTVLVREVSVFFTLLLTCRCPVSHTSCSFCPTGSGCLLHWPILRRGSSDTCKISNQSRPASMHAIMRRRVERLL